MVQGEIYGRRIQTAHLRKNLLENFY